MEGEWQIWFMWLLVVMTIGSQIPHVFHVFYKFNQLEREWAKKFQSGIFCGIISLAILYFGILGHHWWALGGAMVEILFNFYYYSSSLIKFKSWKERFKKQWIAYFWSILIPFCIWIFSFWLGYLLEG